MTEKIIHQQVCDYLKLQYPDVIFTSDASGLRVTAGLRSELKRKRCINYKIPDLHIMHPKGGYHGLFIEIKKDKSDLYNKDGSYKKSNHIEAQVKTIERLRAIGYYAVFGCGFDECKNIIDLYMV